MDWHHFPAAFENSSHQKPSWRCSTELVQEEVVLRESETRAVFCESANLRICESAGICKFFLCNSSNPVHGINMRGIVSGAGTGNMFAPCDVVD